MSVIAFPSKKTEIDLTKHKVTLAGVTVKVTQFSEVDPYFVIEWSEEKNVGFNKDTNLMRLCFKGYIYAVTAFERYIKEHPSLTKCSFQHFMQEFEISRTVNITHLTNVVQDGCEGGPHA